MSKKAESEFLLSIDSFWRIKSDGVSRPVVDSNSISRAQNPLESAQIGDLIGGTVSDVCVDSLGSLLIRFSNRFELEVLIGKEEEWGSGWAFYPALDPQSIFMVHGHNNGDISVLAHRCIGRFLNGSG
ncbi:MAG: hypothetical protein AB7M93_30745 [Candidatus Obscuribacterales bacterium]